MPLPRLSGLQVSALVYGLLYLIGAVLLSFPSSRGSIIAATHPESLDLEVALAQLLFLLFCAGVLALWTTRVASGIIFLLWYALVIWMDAFSTRYGAGGGIMPILGAPVALIGLVALLGAIRARPVVASPGGTPAGPPPN